jgi:hypothetical protein
MQPKQFFAFQRVGLPPLIVLVISCLGILASCVDPKTKATITGPTCVTLTKDQIQKGWIDPGYTKPGATDKITWLKLYTSYGGPETNFSANVHGMETDNTEPAGSKLDLNTGTDCNVKLPDDLAIGSNSIDISTLDIFNADGTVKKELEYVKFTPQLFPSNRTFMNYAVEVVYTTGAQQKGGTLPCPPCIYCRPPCDSL